MQVLLFINNKHAHTGEGIKQRERQHAAPAGGDRLPITHVFETLVRSSCLSTYRAAAKC